MFESYVGLLAVPVFVAFVVLAAVRLRRRRVGPGASGAVYDLLNEEKRRAVEIIVEQQAEATDPEHADDIVRPPRDGRGSTRPEDDR